MSNKEPAVHYKNYDYTLEIQVEPGWNGRGDCKKRKSTVEGGMGWCRQTMEDPFRRKTRINIV